MARRSARLARGLAAAAGDDDTLKPKKVAKKNVVATKKVTKKPKGASVAKKTRKKTAAESVVKGTKVKKTGSTKGVKAPKIAAAVKKKKEPANANPAPTTKDSKKHGADTLPRTRELELLQENNDISFVMGIDEAGRGPLAGPVVAAAVLSTCTTIDGICDSKKLTKEPVREELFHKLTTSPSIRYAVAVVDAQTIDEINILQATYKAMSMAASGVLGLTTVRYEDALSTKHLGCYVVNGATNESGDPAKEVAPLDPSHVMSLIDGNRMPPALPTEGETMVKGDGREYLIGAASILAKVSRDALMHEYHAAYPHFLLNQHKGYGTAKHMALVHEHGPLPIHRLTFAPLKHMDLGGDAKDEQQDEQTTKKKKKKSKATGKRKKAS